MKINKRIITFFIPVFILFMKNMVYADNGPINVTRIYGADRYETSVNISNAYSKDSVSNVIIASGNDFPDALTGSGLSQKYNAPILLVNNTVSGSINTINYVSDHLSKTGTIYILGGKAVVSADFEKQFQSMGFSNIVRLGGQNRYETNKSIIQMLSVPKGTPMIIVNGFNFPDALSVSSIAAIKKYPIILSDSEHLSKELMETIADIQPTKVYLIGGNQVLGDGVYQDIKKIIPAINDAAIERIYGNNRYETNLKVCSAFNINSQNVILAYGENYPDALSGSALAIKLNAPIILTDGIDVDAEEKYISDNNYNNIIVLGGPSLIDTKIEVVLGKKVQLVNQHKYNIVEEYSLTSNVDASFDFTANVGVSSNSNYQKELNISVTGDGMSLSKKEDEIYAGVSGRIKTGQTLKYSIIRTVLNSGIKYSIDPAKVSADYSNYKDFAIFTSPEEKIESDNPIIKLKAEELFAGITNPYLKAKKAYEFVNSYMTYTLVNANKGAMHAIKTSSGDCEDYSELFVALLRASGVPSRVVTGLLVEPDEFIGAKADSTNDGHAWPEFYINGYGWIVAEPTNNSPVVDYSFFANLDEPSHFEQSYSVFDRGYRYSSNLMIEERSYIVQIN